MVVTVRKKAVTQGPDYVEVYGTYFDQHMSSKSDKSGGTETNTDASVQTSITFASVLNCSKASPTHVKHTKTVPTLRNGKPPV